MKLIIPDGSLVESALQYAAQGFHIFPLFNHTTLANGKTGCSCGKRDCSSPGKHPRTPNGLKAATTDPTQIRNWLKSWPDANLGLATGKSNKLIIIDVDENHAGDKSLEQLQNLYGELPPTLSIRSGRGRHLYFEYPNIEGPIPNQVNLANCSGIDLRGDGGYIVAPPSRHINGSVYTVETSNPAAPLPDKWMPLITGETHQKGGEGRIDLERFRKEGVLEGSRDRTLFRALCKLAEQEGALLDDMEEYAVEAAGNCTPPFTEVDAIKKAREVYAKYAPREKKPATSLASFTSFAPPLPTIEEAAYQGLAGEFVKLVEPHTESDPRGVLVHLLSMVGIALGSGPYFEVASTEHRTNIFIIVEGDTALGGKGTARADAFKLFKLINSLSDWRDRNVVSGLSTGEGLIKRVRDKDQPEGGACDDDAPDDEDDKRVLFIESEFASPLKVMDREGNTLSPTIRNAWDGGPLSILTKNDPMRATNHHIGIIGHTTKVDLKRYLRASDTANGFANRFIWAHVEGVKDLPYGGDFPADALQAIALRLEEVLEFWRDNPVRIEWHPESRPIWEDVYGSLKRGRIGLVGDITSRGRAQVTRLSMIYACLDKSAQIKPEHLRAALAVWNYSVQSCRYIFGDSLGVPVADRILDALRDKGSKGLSRTEISNNILKRHKQRWEIDEALALLRKEGLAYLSEPSDEKRKPEEGRPPEIWKAVQQGAKKAN